MTIWNNGPIPLRLLEDEEFPLSVRAEVMSEMMMDEPSPSDMRAIFIRYSESTAEERDAMNAAFVWLTGWTLQTLAARTVVGEKGDWPAKIRSWNRRGTRSR